MESHDVASIICQALEIGHVEEPDELVTSAGYVTEGHDVGPPPDDVLTSVVQVAEGPGRLFASHAARRG